MPITVTLRSAGLGAEARLTFDGAQRVVIGRGASCDVRLPDAAVSHRHAHLRAQGSDFVVVDEGSTNGTFLGDLRVPPNTSRVVRSGDVVRVGRTSLELRVEQRPVTRDLAAATRDLALALVSRALAARGKDLTARVRVVEGPDQGATMALRDEDRAYVVGRSDGCDLRLADADVSREHASVVRRASCVWLRDLGAKNGVSLGAARLEADHPTPWRPAQMARLGGTVLALDEPAAEELARIEGAPDEALSEAAEAAGSRAAVDAPTGAPAEAVPPPTDAPPIPARLRGRTPWPLADRLLIAAAATVLALSVAALFWLLR